MLELKLLGSPQILLNGQPVTGLSAIKSQALLFYLALSGRPQSRLALAGLLWPDKREADALANLRQALYHLRNALPAYLAVTRLTLALNHEPPSQVDVLLFEQESSATNPIALRQSAIDRYTGDFLSGFYVEEAQPFEEWAMVLRERLHQLATQAVQQLVTHFVDQRETGSGLRYTNQWLTFEPWREEAHRHKLRLLAWDGQSQAALAHYDRCREVLATELGAAPEAETVALYEQIRNGHFASRPRRPAEREPAPPLDRQSTTHTPLLLLPPPPALPRAATPSHNLPTHRPLLIGRETEVAQLCALVLDPAQRVVTVVGPGGAGKTQVALAAAQRIIDFGFSIADDDTASQIQNSPFPDGIWFVPLAGVMVGLPDAEAAVVSAILQALQVTPVGATPPRQHLANALQQKQLLLVLDHFDHLSAATPLITALLQAAPHLCLLLTAPTALGLAAEVVMPLAGLAAPPQDHEPQALAYSSVRLLRERAGRAWPTFALAGETLHAIIRICRLVDGLPLGLELVASWTSSLSYSALAQALAEKLVLVEKGGDAPTPRQSGLQAVCEFVWQRLMPAEQVALATATVFQGSFSRAAFLAVTKARLTDLVSLHDRALLQQEGVGRYVMPDGVRHFAGQKLATEMGGGEEVRNRHAEYYANFLQACEPELKTAGQSQTLAAIQLDLHNIHAMWQRTMRLLHLPTVEKAQESLWLFYCMQGRYWEGEALFAAAATALTTLEVGAGQPSTHHALALGQVLSWQGWCQMAMGRSAEALELLQQSLTRFAQASARMHRTMAYTHLAAGQIHLFWDEPAQAITHFTEGLTHAQECGDPWGIAYCTFRRGPLTQATRQYKLLAVHYEASLATLRGIGDPCLLADCLVLYADTAMHLGEYDRVEGYLQESHQLSQDLNLPVALLATRLGLGELYRRRGQGDEAKEMYVACLHECTATADKPNLMTVLRALGLLAYAGQAYDEAKQYLQESLRLAQQSGCPSAVVLALTALGDLYWQLGDSEQAKATQQKSVALAQQLPQREDLQAAALGGLAAVESGLEAYAVAEATYQQALTLAVQTEAPPLILDLLVGLAALRWKTGNAAPAPIATWLTLACQHPAGVQATKDHAAQLLAEVTATMPTAAQQATPPSHQGQDWPALLAAVLADAVQRAYP